jgi:hypothetical protein
LLIRAEYPIIALMQEQTTPVRDLIGSTLHDRINAVIEEGRDIFERFDSDVRSQRFHPFIPADYDIVLRTLVPLRAPGLRFLEWGSGSGVITIMADMLGFEASGIEIDGELVAIARELGARTGSGANFAEGSFLPAGYRWKPAGGDGRLGTIGLAESGYLALGRPLDDFDLVFGYPWDGEQPMMLDLMRQYGSRQARFLLNTPTGVRIYRDGRELKSIA